MAYTTIDNPELYFQVKLWTGDDSTDNAITFDGEEDMQADLIWLKPRTKGDNHRWMDSVRGVTKMLPSNSSGAEETISAGLASFDSNGFTLNTTDGGYNSSSYTYVAWNWKESATSGFDIVSFTGNETARTISHSLSAIPHVMIMKSRANAVDWSVYHHKNTSAPETDYLFLNTTAATADSVNFWNDTAPTSSVFSLGSSGYSNATGTMIGYLFAEKQGFSKFGSYVANGNADGTFVFCGFRPAFVMFKNSSAVQNWSIMDNKRDGFNSANKNLGPNTTGTEDDTTGYIDFLSNGFKLRNSWTVFNGSGNTIVYMAFAEAPFVNSNGVPNNAR